MSLTAGVHNLQLRKFRYALLLLLALAVAPLTMNAAPPSAPPITVDPSLANLFYGATPMVGGLPFNGPVVVFVHGMSADYQDWIEKNNCPTSITTCTGSNNTMYDLAYQAGLRTVFLSLSPDNSPNKTNIQTNAAMLQSMFPKILAHYGVSKVYFVCHSKGGLDLSAAIVAPQWLSIANMVIMLGTPNQGDALADWLFSPAGNSLGQLLGLLTPAVQSLEIANVQSLRAQWDPVFANARIPFYTVSGNTYNCANGTTGCSTATTGPILASITGGNNAQGQPKIYNDGLVDHLETLLPTNYAMEMGVLPTNHFGLFQGALSFPFIFGHVMAWENSQAGPQEVANGGFGDQHNTWAWSMTYFNNNLYVGTGREVYCVTSATAAINLGIPGLYPPAIGDCTPDYHYLPLQAEIWQYNPATLLWTRVFQSPATPTSDPLNSGLTTIDNNHNKVNTARDIGFRGLQLVTEPGCSAACAIYAGGVTSGEMFEPTNLPGSWPPPRIMRSTDGVHWAPLPQNGTLAQTSTGSVWTPASGSFLGALTANGDYGTTQYPIYSIRSATQLNGTLFLQVGDYPGVGRVISSSPGVNPAQGDNCSPAPPTGCYQWASPPTSTLPIWILENFNNQVYAGTGTPPGAPASTYGVFKTDGVTPPPPGDNWAYNWVGVISDGAYATGLVADYAMSLGIFIDPTYCPSGCLYVGTDRPNELVRIHPDLTGKAPGLDGADSWDLVIGNPRTIPVGFPGAGTPVDPISGIGQYFDNGFTGHFWRMGVGSQGLYLGTWDWSADNAYQPTFGPLWSQEFGTDLWRTPDGVHWSMVSKLGLGDGNNTGSRSFINTNFGLYMGTARSIGGAQVFNIDNGVLDFNHDGVVDQKDVYILIARVNQPALRPHDSMDLDGDGKITRNDVLLLQKHCTYANCATPPAIAGASPLAAPVLNSAPGALAIGATVSLSWNAITGAKDYVVYRIGMSPNTTTAPPGINGTAAAACSTATGSNAALCSHLPAAQGVSSPSTGTTPYGYPGPPVIVTRVSSPAYSEQTTSNLQNLYFVRAEDANGNLSPPSNIVGGPSLAAN